jgi:exodeoxyribonuclease-3
VRIATWNINSVRLRSPLLQQLTQEQKPDIICLQETKVVDELFPHDIIHKLGYPHRYISGQKSYNGVAILSKKPLKNVKMEAFCGSDHKRHISAALPGGIELHNFYVPAGGDIPDPKANDKFAFKLEFLKAMLRWSEKRNKIPTIMVGDINVAPLPNDVWSHRQLLGVVSHTPIETTSLEKVRASGNWVDTLRHFVPPEEKLYSWWSYRNQDWRKSDRGRRLDHIWVTPDLKSSLKKAHILKDARDWKVPSDHVPVVMEIKD